MKRLILTLAILIATLFASAQKTYQVNVASTTVSGITLNAGFTLEVYCLRVKDNKLALSVNTRETVTSPVLSDGESNVDSTILEFGYDPAQDNSKSVNILLTENWETLLDTWFGASNWVAL